MKQLAGMMAALAAVLPAYAAEWKPTDWAPIQDNDLKIVAGSPLDFSGLLPAGTVATNGPVVNNNGRLVFQNFPSEKAKLNCASLTWSPGTGSFPDEATATAFVAQLKLHGYNVVRFHYVEGILMHLVKVDNQVDEVQLARFHALLKKLKDAGIYWVMDLMSSENGTLGDNESNRWVSHKDLKFRVQILSDLAARKAWEDEVQAIYARVNPHTGLSILNDPALIAVNLVNEGEINFLESSSSPYRNALKQPFNDYLKTIYSNDNELRTAWGTDLEPLATDESLATNSVKFPGKNVQSERNITFQKFLTKLERDSVAWMTTDLRNLGYQGLITNYNNWDRIPANDTRATLELIDGHSYTEEVAAVSSAGTGTAKQNSQTDSPDDNLATRLAGMRQANKPFIVTEYGQPFWNQYRFEASVTVPAIAALQNWDMICLHGEGGIDLSFDQPGASRKQAINPYGVGIDPVLRAGETLSALLFLRGDVAPSPNRVRIKYPSPNRELKTDVTNAVLPDLRQFGFMSGLEIIHPDNTNQAQPSVSGKVLELNPGYYLWSASDGYLGKYTTGMRTKQLVDAAILPSSYPVGENKPTFYQSDTGQFYLDKTNRRITVTTPRSEVISTAQATGTYNFNTLKVTSINGPALLSASTLNEGNLDASKRILLIFATDALNKDMTFTDETRVTLKSLGKMPVVIRPGSASVSVQLKHKTPMRLIALDLKGNRRDEITLHSIENIDGIEWQFTLNNTGFSFGPTTFFVLEEVPAS
jgi:hypothetical protein